MTQPRCFHDALLYFPFCCYFFHCPDNMHEISNEENTSVHADRDYVILILILSQLFMVEEDGLR